MLNTLFIRKWSIFNIIFYFQPALQQYQAYIQQNVPTNNSDKETNSCLNQTQAEQTSSKRFLHAYNYFARSQVLLKLINLKTFTNNEY